MMRPVRGYAFRQARIAVACAAMATMAVLAGPVVASSAPSAGAQTGPTGYTFVTGFFGGGSVVCDFLAVDLPTAVATQLSGPQGVPCVDGLAFAADGTLYGFTTNFAAGASESQLVTVDTADGSSTPIGSLPSLFGGGMTFDAAGALWLTGNAPFDPDCNGAVGTCLWQVDPATAATTFVGQLPDQVLVGGYTATCDETQGLAQVLPNGPVSPVSLDRVDTTDATLETIVETPAVFNPVGLDYDTDGTLWAIGSENTFGRFPPIQVYEIDPATGASTAADLILGDEPLGAVPMGLGIAPLSCEVPPPPPPAPPAPDVVVVQPTFTG